MQVSPGHFSLPLSINRIADPERIRYKQNVLQCLLRQKRHRPESHAIRNLLGLLAARVAQYDEAMGHFMKVTSEEQDVCNLNAYANMKQICEFQYKFREAASNESKLKEYANLAITDDGEELDEMQSESRKVHARCMAEQAYAITVDLDDLNRFHGHRYRRAYDWYKAALQMGENDVGEDEMQDWEFHLGVVCYNIGTALINNFEERVVWEPFLMESMECLCKTYQVKDKSISAESWCYIGKILFICKQCNVSDPGSIELDEKIQKMIGMFLDNPPEECLHKAKEIKADQASVYVHHAELIQQFDLEKALELVNEAICLDDESVLKRKAYSLRGQLLKTKYVAETQEFRKIIYTSDMSDGEDTINEEFQEVCRDHEPDRDILHKAKEDFEVAIDIAINPFELSALGETWHLLAKDVVGEVFPVADEEAEQQVEDNLNKALMYFTRATHCMDGALDSTINYLRGLCLYDCKEKEAALESFKQAMECQQAGNKNIASFASLIEVYLSLIHDNIEDSRYQKRLLSEMVYWSELAISTYGASDVRDYILESDQWSDMPEAVAKFVTFCETTNRVKAHMVFSAALSRKARSKRRRRISLKINRARTPSPDRSGDPSPPTPISAPVKMERPSFNLVAESESDCVTPVRPRHQSKPGVTGAGDCVEEDSKVDFDSDQEVMSETLRTDEIPEAPEQARFEGYEYDFFVVYSPSANDWVDYNLLPKLERTQGLKGCTKDRDFIIGCPKVQNFTRCIENSAVIILVLDKDFEDTPDCQANMNYALTPELRKHVIPIVRDDCKIPLVLRHITSLDATGVVNWNKLRDSIYNLVEASEVS